MNNFIAVGMYLNYFLYFLLLSIFLFPIETLFIIILLHFRLKEKKQSKQEEETETNKHTEKKQKSRKILEENKREIVRKDEEEKENIDTLTHKRDLHSITGRP